MDYKDTYHWLWAATLRHQQFFPQGKVHVGVDFDGVTTAGVRVAATEKINPVFITGRAIDERSTVLDYVSQFVEDPKVCNYPEPKANRLAGDSGVWKGLMCLRYGIQFFLEDNTSQMELIHRISPNTLVLPISKNLSGMNILTPTIQVFEFDRNLELYPC